MYNGHPKKTKIVFQDKVSLNAGQKCCRMLQGEHFAILLTFSKQPFVIKIFVLSIFEWLFYTGFTVQSLFISILSNIWILILKENIDSAIVIKLIFRPKGYKTFFMLYSTEHKISTAHKIETLKKIGISCF